MRTATSERKSPVKLFRFCGVCSRVNGRPTFSSALKIFLRAKTGLSDTRPMSWKVLYPVLQVRWAQDGLMDEPGLIKLEFRSLWHWALDARVKMSQ